MDKLTEQNKPIKNDALPTMLKLQDKIKALEDEIGKLILQVKLLIEKEENPCKMLEIYAIHHMNLIKEKKALAEVLQMELRQSNKFMKEYRNTKFIEYIDIISSIIHKGQEMDIFSKDIMPGVAKRAFFGALDEMSRLWILAAKPPYTLEQTAKQISKIFLQGLIMVGYFFKAAFLYSFKHSSMIGVPWRKRSKLPKVLKKPAEPPIHESSTSERSCSVHGANRRGRRQ